MGVTNTLAGGQPDQVTATSVVNKFPVFYGLHRHVTIFPDVAI